MTRAMDLFQQAKTDLREHRIKKSEEFFRQAALKGHESSLRYIGKCILHQEIKMEDIFENRLLNSTIKNSIEAYLKAGLIKEKNLISCIDFLIANRVSYHLNFEKSRYYLDLAYKTFDPNTNQKQKIHLYTEKRQFEKRFPDYTTEDPINDLDYYWAITNSFWVQRYRENSATKALLEECPSKTTQHRFKSAGVDGEFARKSGAWSELKYHLDLKLTPLYLVYVENELNRPEVANLVADTLRCYGYEVTLCEWKSIESIPENAAVAVLSDSALLAESHKPKEEQCLPYQLIQQHSGKKIWVPWQIPAEMSLPRYWEMLPSEWQDWICISFSLLEEPHQALDNIVGHLFPEAKHQPIVTYLQNFTDGNKINLQENWQKYRKIINSLTIKEDSKVDVFTFMDLMTKTKETSKNLYSYITPHDSVFAIYLQHNITSMSQLGKKIKSLKSLCVDQHQLLINEALETLNRFESEKSKRNSLFAEISHLACSEDPIIAKRLFNLFFHYFHKKSHKLDLVKMLCSFKRVLMLTPKDQFNKSRLLLLQEDLMKYLQDTHVQSTDKEEVCELLKTTNLVLGIMQEVGIENVEREKFKVEYYKQIGTLQNKLPDSLKPATQQIAASLNQMKDDETMIGAASRRGIQFFRCAANIAVMGLTLSASVRGVCDGFQHLYEAVKVNIPTDLGKNLTDFQYLLLDLDFDQGKNSLKPCENFINELDKKIGTIDDTFRKKIRAFLLIGMTDMINDLVIQWCDDIAVQSAAIELIFKMIQLKKNSDNEEIKKSKELLTAYIEFYANKKEEDYTALSIFCNEKLLQLRGAKLAGQGNLQESIAENSLTFRKGVSFFQSFQADFEHSRIKKWAITIFPGMGNRDRLLLEYEHSLPFFHDKSSINQEILSLILESNQIRNTNDISEISRNCKEKNKNYYETLKFFTVELIDCFERKRIKKIDDFREMIYLTQIKENDLLVYLFGTLCHLLPRAVETTPDYTTVLICCLNLTLENLFFQNYIQEIKPNQLMQLLDSLVSFLEKIHIQKNDEHDAYYVIKAINFVIFLMAEKKVENADSQKIKKYYESLLKVENRCSKTLNPLIKGAINALEEIPKGPVGWMDYLLLHDPVELAKFKAYKAYRFVKDRENLKGCFSKIKDVQIKIYVKYAFWSFLYSASNPEPAPDHVYQHKISKECVEKLQLYLREVSKQNDVYQLVNFALEWFQKIFEEKTEQSQKIFDKIKKCFYSFSPQQNQEPEKKEANSSTLISRGNIFTLFPKDSKVVIVNTIFEETKKNIETQRKTTRSFNSNVTLYTKGGIKQINPLQEPEKIIEHTV